MKYLGGKRFKVERRVRADWDSVGGECRLKGGWIPFHTVYSEKGLG